VSFVLRLAAVLHARRAAAVWRWQHDDERADHRVVALGVAVRQEREDTNVVSGLRRSDGDRL